MTDRVQQAVWDWRSPRQAKAERVTPGALLGQMLVLLAVAAVFWFWLGHRIPALVVLGLAGFFLLLGLLVPRAWLKISGWGRSFGGLVGRVLGVVLLAPVFLLVILPGGLVLRITGRDPLHRKLRRQDLTYWIRRRRQPARAEYARQFIVEDKEARSEHRPLNSASGTGSGGGA